MQIIDGKKISQEIKDEVKEEVAQLKAEGKDIALAVIQVGADPASSVYVRNKKRACEYVGIESISYELPEETTQEELLSLRQRQKEITNLLTDNNNGVVLEENEAEEIELEI